MQKQPAIGEFDVIFDKNQAPPPDHYQDEEVEEIMEDSKDTLGGFVGGALGALNGFHASENNLLEQLNEEH